MQAEARDIDIVRMERYLPVQRGAEDIYKWFNLPHDGHWSNYGATLYSAAVHAALLEHLSGMTSDGPVERPATARVEEDSTRNR